MNKRVGDDHRVFDRYNLPDDECSVYSEPKVIYILNRMTSSEVCKHIPLDVFNYMYGLQSGINKQIDEIEELKNKNLEYSFGFKAILASQKLECALVRALKILPIH